MLLAQSMPRFPPSCSEHDRPPALKNLQELCSSQLPSPCKVPPKPSDAGWLPGVAAAFVSCPRRSQVCAASFMSESSRFMSSGQVSAVCRGRASTASDATMVTGHEQPLKINTREPELSSRPTFQHLGLPLRSGRPHGICPGSCCFQPDSALESLPSSLPLVNLLPAPPGASS